MKRAREIIKTKPVEIRLERAQTWSGPELKDILTEVGILEEEAGNLEVEDGGRDDQDEIEKQDVDEKTPLEKGQEAARHYYDNMVRPSTKRQYEGAYH